MSVSIEEGLPPKALWPERVYTLPETRYPVRLNVATELLDANADGGRAGRPAIHYQGQVLTYPRHVAFVPALPRTETGKIRRVELRQQEAGRAAQP